MPEPWRKSCPDDAANRVLTDDNVATIVTAERVHVLALDYDGTIAQDGRLHPDVRTAIEEARTRGITVVLVTGRILGDLRRACAKAC
jgi:soluble P-type ATPase